MRGAESDGNVAASNARTRIRSGPGSEVANRRCRADGSLNAGSGSIPGAAQQRHHFGEDAAVGQRHDRLVVARGAASWRVARVVVGLPGGRPCLAEEIGQRRRGSAPTPSRNVAPPEKFEVDRAWRFARPRTASSERMRSSSRRRKPRWHETPSTASTATAEQNVRSYTGSPRARPICLGALPLPSGTGWRPA